MTQHSTRFVGQPVAAASDCAVASRDKWRLVDDLTRAADAYGLSHRSLTVLRSMLSFVPERDLSPLPGRAVVFASNATLSDRLGGMPESTLRRHLAALVAAGIVSRHDSPNRKRFARRRGDAIVLAFGFDLAPLAARAAEIARKAQAARTEAEDHATLRCAVLEARQSLLLRLTDLGLSPEAPMISPLLARSRLMLRRKGNHAELRQLLNDYAEALNAPELSASDSQNGRHQHKKKNTTSEEALADTAVRETAETVQPQDQSNCRETLASTESRAPETRPDHQMAAPRQVDPGLHQDSQTMAGAFPEYRRMFPQGARSWADLREQARQLIPMMGIDMQVYDEAERTLGRQIAPIAVLCLLERFDSLRNPGGFLRHLSRQGQVDLPRLLASAGIVVS